MRIGIPREIKPMEGRVALIPAACSELTSAGHRVFVQSGAGAGSGYNDEDFTNAGAKIVIDAATLYDSAQLVVKVKEPVEPDLHYLRRHHILFSFLHLAANSGLTRALCDIGLTALGFETVQENSGELPLLAPMSDIAGRLAVHYGAYLLHQPQGGKGLLLGGVAAAERGRVTVIGAGSAGGNAARVAAALGAQVSVFDRKRDRLEAMRDLGDNVTALYPYPDTVERAVVGADLVIGAVLIPGARAPHLVTGHQVGMMQPGSVVVDISVDQGGCIETTRPTTYESPTYLVGGVVHLAVTNMPGAVPRTASQVLSAALTPLVMELANGGVQASARLQRGINVKDGQICHPALRLSAESN